MDGGYYRLSGPLLIAILMLSGFTVLDFISNDASGEVEEIDIQDIDFEYKRLYREGDSLYRAAFGDLIPGNGLTEVAASSKNGMITVTYGSDMSWETETAAQIFIGDNPNDPAQVYSLAAVDLYEEYPGDELLSVDEDYNVRMTRYTEDGWKSEVIFTDPGPDWLYEIAVGEMVEEVPGPEIVIVGDSQIVTLMTRSSTGWTGETIFIDNFALDACFIDDVDPGDPGNEVIVGGGDNNLTMISGSQGNWIHTDIAHLGSSIMDILTQDLDPNIPGNEIYASTFSGEVYQIYRDGETYQKRMVHDEGALVYGLEAGQIEGATVVSMATWNSRVALLYYDEGFKVKEAYREDYYLLGTGIYDIDPYHKGNEIIGLSVLGYLTMIYHDDPGVDIILPFDRSVVSLNEDLSVPFILRYKGGYAGGSTITVEENGRGSVVYNKEGVYSFILEGYSTAGTRNINVKLHWEGGSREIPFSLVVEDHNRSLAFSTDLINGSVGADKQLIRTFSILSINDVGSPLTISGTDLPTGIDVEISPDVVDPLGDPVSVTSTVRVQPETGIMEHFFFVKGSNIYGMNRAIGYSIDVKEASTADFDILIQSPAIELAKGENTTFDLLVVSTSGFDSEVALQISDPIEDLQVTFSKSIVIPTDTVQVTVLAMKDSGPYFVHVEGTSGTLKREDSIRIDTTPPSRSLRMYGPDEPVILKKDGEKLVGEFGLTVEPVNGVIEDAILKVDSSAEDLTVTTSPAPVSRIPYKMNITFMITLTDPGEDGLIEINFTSEEGFWTYSIQISMPEDEGNDGGDRAPVFILVLLVAVVLIAGAMLLLINRGNIINRGEEVEEDHGSDRRDRGIHPPTERRHGRGGGLDRLGRYGGRP